MSKINLVFFRMSPDAPLVKELANYYKKNENYNVEFINSDAEANQFLANDGNGIFLFEVKTKIDLQVSTNVLKDQKKIIKAGLLKPACILSVKNKKVEKILSKYGCVDLLDEDIRAKTFSFKIDFWSRALQTLLKKKDKELELKSTGATKEEKKDTKKSDFNLVEPLKLQSDMWLIKSKSDYKKILRRWLIRVLGPSPHAGSWMELEAQPGDKLPTWKYVLKNNDGKFVLDDGAWFFSGSKPEFDWKINRWNFSSDAPHLYFYTQDGQVFSRFKFENGAMTIAENSRYAQSKEEFILETCSNKFNIEGDDAVEDSKSNIEGDEEDSLENLEGDLDGTNEDLGGSLSGKVNHDLNSEEEKETRKSNFKEDEIDNNWGGEAGTDKIDQGPLGGKIKKNKDLDGDIASESDFDEEEIETHWGGEGSTDAIDQGPLAGKLKPTAKKEKDANKRSEFSEEDTGGHYGGKSSTDELENSPLAGKLKPTAKKDSKQKDGNSFQEGEIETHWGGEGSTDDIDQGPLAGKLKPTAKKEKDAKNSSEFSEEDVGGHYGGKSSTDELDRSPLAGKLKPSIGKPKDAKNRSDFSEEDLGGHYGGEGSTDELDRGPLAGKLKPTVKKDNNGKDHKGFAEDDLGGHYGGEGSTDELDRGPLAGKLKPTVKKDNNGKDHKGFAEDDLGGHYGGEGSTDELDRGPLAGKLKPTVNKDAKNKDHSAISEEDLGGHYGGEGSTDELDHGPLAGKLKPTVKKIAKPKDKNDLDDEDLNAQLDDDTLGDVAQPGSLANKIRNPLGNKVKANLEDMNSLPGEDAFADEEPVRGSLPKRDKLAKPPIAFSEEEEAEIEDELSRAGLRALDKNGKPIPMAEVARMTEEELSRAGIKVLDKDGKPIPVEDIAKEIEKELSRSGIKPLLKDKIIGAKKEKEEAQQEEQISSKTSLNNGIKEKTDAGKTTTDHRQNLKPKEGREIWDDEAVSLSDITSETSKKRNPFGNRTKADTIATEMEEALGGGLAQEGSLLPLKEDEKPNLSQVIGKAVEVEEKDPFDLEAIIGSGPDVNLESGELKVVIKQKTKVGNDISFICDFEDFYEDELVVQAPRYSLPVGSDIVGKVALYYGGQKVVIEVEGKIAEIEDFGNKKETLIIALEGVDSSLYEKFMDLYQNRQENIEDFMQKAKGY